MENVILVDELDQEKGVEEKMSAHRQGLLHRAFSVFVFNNTGQLLLQQRAASKYHSPLLWTNTCCSHPRPGEETLDAAHRRCKEEMGIEPVLLHAFSFIYKVALDQGLTEHEYDHVFIGINNETPVLNPEEVAAYKWVNLQDVQQHVKKHPQHYTVWFAICLDQVIEHYKKMNTDLSIFWHRRDLRLQDNTGLFHALQSPYPVQPLFIFDTTILDQLEDKSDARVTFIYQYIKQLKSAYEKHGGSLLVEIGKPLDVFEKLLKYYSIKAVYTNNDYEPKALQRDEAVNALLHKNNISFHSYKDHVVFEKHEVAKKDGTPYTIYTPYMRAWKALYAEKETTSFPSEKGLNQLLKQEPLPLPSLKKIGFEVSPIPLPSPEVTVGLIKQYDKQRDYPAIPGTSHLGIHFRFGTISIRQKMKHAMELNGIFFNELIWREFYQMIIFHFPHSAKDSFKTKYDTIAWQNDEHLFDKWCKGETGYPIVDAGMRELNATGFMHNRVRMIVASFLSKHLLIDWRWGETYFAEKLLDYELASNVGGWQWAAGCGCDAAPYFRVFNPTLQADRFDPKQVYIKKWVPEFGTTHYVKPIVEHVFARNRAIATYKRALS